MKSESPEKRVSRNVAPSDLLRLVHWDMPKPPGKPNGLSEILRKAKGDFPTCVCGEALSSSDVCIIARS